MGVDFNSLCGTFMLSFFCYAIVAHVIITIEAARFRRRAIRTAREGMARIEDLDTRAVRWARCRDHILNHWKPHEYVLQGGSTLLARYWIGNSTGELMEIETSEGRWVCTRKKTKVSEAVQIRMPGFSTGLDSATFTFDVNWDNLIRGIEFPGGRRFAFNDIFVPGTRWRAPKDTHRSELVDEGGVIWIKIDREREEAEIQAAAWASADRRELVLLACYAGIRKRYYETESD